MKINAQFKGKNSLGYVQGKTYILLLSHSNIVPTIYIIRYDETGPCEYSSIVAFLNNWTNIKSV